MATVATAALIATTALPVGAAPNQGYLTSVDPMLQVTVEGGWEKPIISVGDVIGGYRFEAIPDGVAVWPKGKGTVDIYVNHETSRVPFPLAANGSAYQPTTNGNGSQNDFLNSQVSQLRLHQSSAGVLSASYAIDSGAGYQRFCSNFLASAEHGFKKPMLFTNEEGIDWVKTSDPTFPAFPGDADARQIGVAVAYDVQNGKHRPIWGMGRHNHENTMALPGYGSPVLISGDDTFTTSPAQSQLYMYTADSASAVWNDTGTLWAFVSDDPTRQKYEDFAPGDASSIAGHFIEVPKLIATGKNPDGTELMAADVPADLDGPFPLPPNDGTWQRFNNVGIDGPQWVLEYWSRQNDVFNFIRIEDTAYDKRPGQSNTFYIVDSGRGTGSASPPHPQGPGISTNGRVWKMVLDPEDPTQVDALSILIEGDDQPTRHPGRIHQPDNIESTPVGLYITEDPGSQQNFPFGSIDPESPNFDPNATNARLWQYRLQDAAMSVVAVVDQSLDGAAGYDVDGLPPATHGFWESSGVVDVSHVFGPGTFLVTVQAHSLWVDRENGPDSLTRLAGAWSEGPDGFPDWINKREGGQMLLIHIPGG